MNTIFDKIYVVSLLPNNKDRQEFIKHQLDDLYIDFEFIYGIDYFNIKTDYKDNNIIFPKMHDYDLSNGKIFGSSIGHYHAVLQAYELGYNNVLILEDDVCFLKERTLIEYYLNNVPEDADFVSWDPRFINSDEHKLILNMLKKSDQSYILLENNIDSLIGAMIYGIMNRDAMKIYIESQHKIFLPGDHVRGFFEYPTVKRYISSKCICTDQHNIEKNFNADVYYECIYKEIDDKLTTDLFYKPKKYSSFIQK